MSKQAAAVALGGLLGLLQALGLLQLQSMDKRLGNIESALINRGLAVGEAVAVHHHGG